MSHNLIDFLLINFYNGNADWDDNNFQAARSDALGDDRWRFFVWDSDAHRCSTLAITTKPVQSLCEPS